MPPLPLVGRKTELASLSATLGDAAAGRPGTRFLSGESGVGKTRLARDLMHEAAQRDFSLAHGQAFAVEIGVPYAVFGDALLRLLRNLDAAALTVLTRGAAGDLAAIFPALFAESAGGESTTDAKARMFWSFAQLVGRLCARRPLLIVLDNLQWADEASVELLHFLARQAHAGAIDGHLMILGLHTDAERTTATPLAAVERSLVSIGAARMQRLVPLTREQTIELLERRFSVPTAAVRDIAAALHDWTRGNPFFIDETLQSLVGSGQLAQQNGEWTGLARADGWSGAALTPSRSVSDVVLERAARLKPDTRALLDTSAVLGGRIRLSVLRGATSFGELALADAIDELCRAQFLIEAADAHAGPDATYDFSHPLVRDALYAALGRTRARRMHDHVAGALERLYGAEALAHADELAFHNARGTNGADAPGAVRYFIAAGRQAIARYADAAAVAYLEPALHAIDQAPATVAADTGRREVLELLARARQRLGDVGAARALWERAHLEASAVADWPTVAVIERRMGLMSAAANDHVAAIAHYDAGLAALSSDASGELAARLHLARATALHALGRRDEALVNAQTALAIATRSGDRALLGRSHRALLLLHAWTGPAEDARAHGALAAAYAAQSGERALEWSVHWAMAVHAGLTGDVAATARHVSESRRLADDIRSPVLQLWTADVEIEYLAGIGEWPAALAIADRAIPAARALGQRTLLPRLLVWTGLIHRALGDMDRAHMLIQEAWSLSGAVNKPTTTADMELPNGDVHALVPAYMGMAGYLMTAGENERALAVGEAGLAIADRAGYVAWAIYRLLPFVIETALYLEDYERAARYSARLRRDSAAIGHPLGLAWADTTDALLAYLTGNAANAVPLLRLARAALERVSFVFDAARLRRLIARALVDAGDAPAATAELTEAHAIFERLGAEREVRATREELRALGARVPGRRGGAGAGALSARELGIARLVAARKSNKEIGAALDISSRTVSTHLSNIFAKLGVTSRGELADRMRELGGES